jgi:hypothetical protein
MTTVFEALGVAEPTKEITKELSGITYKHFTEKEYTQSDEVLDIIKIHGFKPTKQNKQLVAIAIIYGTSVGTTSSRLNQVFGK